MTDSNELKGLFGIAVRENTVYWCDNTEKCTRMIDINNHIYGTQFNEDGTDLKIVSMNSECLTKSVEKKAKELEEAGHRCITFMESYPPQLCWCQQESCVLVIHS